MFLRPLRLLEMWRFFGSPFFLLFLFFGDLKGENVLAWLGGCFSAGNPVFFLYDMFCLPFFFLCPIFVRVCGVSGGRPGVTRLLRLVRLSFFFKEVRWPGHEYLLTSGHPPLCPPRLLAPQWPYPLPPCLLPPPVRENLGSRRWLTPSLPGHPPPPIFL